MSDFEARLDLLEMDTPTAPDHRGPRPAPVRLDTSLDMPAAASALGAAGFSATTSPAARSATIAPTPAVPRIVDPNAAMRTVDANAPEVVQAVAGAVAQARTEIPRGRTAGVRQSVPVTRSGAAATAPAPAPEASELRAGQMVAGAAAEGNGAMIGWNGAGEAKIATLRAAMTVAGFPAEWAPALKSMHHYCGQAVKSLDSQGLVSRSDRSAVGRTAGVRDYKARWSVGSVNHVTAAAGAAYGETVLVVTLGADDQITYTGSDALGIKVKTTAERMKNDDALNAGLVTKWLGELVRERFHAVWLGPVMYVRAKHVKDCERLLTAVAKTGWGADWMLPVLPVATGAQLVDGIRKSLLAEVVVVETEITAKRNERIKEGATDLHSSSAVAFELRLAKLATRVTYYAELIGSRAVAPIAAKVSALRASVAAAADPTHQRFANIADEMSGSWKEGL